MSQSPHILAARDKFLLELFANKEKPASQQYCKVFLDESYIHEHYHWLKELIWDPNNEQDVMMKLPHKGCWYCFIAAIQGPAPQDHNNYNNAAGMVPGSLWYFCLSQKAQTGDYHKAFNSDDF